MIYPAADIDDVCASLEHVDCPDWSIVTVNALWNNWLSDGARKK